MQAVKPGSKQSPKWGRGMSFSLESSESRALKVPDRKPSMKEKRAQEQLFHFQEELKKETEEKTRVMEELEELRRNANAKEHGAVSLEKEVEKAKQSERKMLESLISQTRQLEQTKISLEEAKLEIRSLQESIRSLEGGGATRQSSSSSSSRGLAKSQSDRNLAKLEDPFDVFRVREEIGLVTKELRLATAAEEKSKRAMDGLALALKEVSTEANYAKARLSSSQTELERARSEAERCGARLRVAEERLQAAEAEVGRLRSEAEDSAATRDEKERGFVLCMKVSEEENAKLEQENARLIGSLRTSREDNSKLRDILKHAVTDASMAKEALEIARNENSRLKDSLSEKESAYRSIRQEYECLKVSEAAAVDSVRELKGLLAATSDVPDCPVGSPVKEVKASKTMVKYPSDQWRGEQGGSGRFHDRPWIRSSVYAYDTDVSDRIDRTPLHGASPAGGEQKKRKTILRRLGERLLSRKSFHK